MSQRKTPRRPVAPMSVLRLAMAILGVALLGIGLLGLPTQLKPGELAGLLGWLAAALVLHDGVLVPLSHLLGGGLRRLATGLQPVSAMIIRTVLLIGATVTLVVLPLLRAQQLARDVSVLQGDYGVELLWFWAALLVLGAAGAALVEVRYRARNGGSAPAGRS
ncbi:hypothetical protein [Psychromicrobium xiongbiense]|uniref:hypothetical protein n=1 Tax=Psychromicrobium xiongbiense TaxID=3051184 RepID=UPI0025558D5C|nr:hypothetical protein [Psychromicrobium sp. YIM S02556]